MTGPIALAIIISPCGVLLGRRPDGSWVFPGGKIERLESPAEAAVREAFEETRLPVRAIRVLGYRYHPDTQAEAYYVACEVVPGETREESTGELEEVRWASPGEADELTGGKIWEPVRAYLRAQLMEG